LESVGFEGLAEALNATERSADGLSYNNMVVPGIGRDPKFVGTALGMSAGETSDVVRGANAAFVVHVTDINEPPPLEPADYSRIREQLLNRRRAQVRSQWIAELRESAEIVDNRTIFFQ
ncbi:MAG: peptidyl-prolyl cis-trans isomerase, partial [Rhodothermales bacterium]|nr:peptidyl-prolyl cis-trans isomerase [Rhodothermales bacterium]